VSAFDHDTATLSEAHLEHLLASGISPEIIAERGYRTVTGKVELHTLEPRFTDRQQRVPAIAFPMRRLGEHEPTCIVIRPDRPRETGPHKKALKYEVPQGAKLCLDVLPRYREALQDPKVPIWPTEGAKKADALATAFGDRIVPINLNGVFGWRGTSAKGGKLALPDLEHIAWNGRRVVLAFDSDVVRKREVMQGLKRFAAVLAAKGADVLVLMLPDEPGNKTGVDDYLVLGHTPADLEALTAPLYDAVSAGREKFGKHPETGDNLFMPPGYLDTRGSIARDDEGRVKVIYPGRLGVLSTGESLETGEETLTVVFDGRGGLPVTVTAPKHELARGKGVLDHLTRRGADASETNASAVAHYIVAFAQTNRETLPHRRHTSRLGLHPSGVAGPGWTVGEAPTYLGEFGSRFRSGGDPDAYPTALREVLNWGEEAWPLNLGLGLSTVSPMLGRLGLTRNPVPWYYGPSGAGKTTAVRFAGGLYLDPTGEPFTLQALKATTPKGILQTLEQMGGFPTALEETHMADPRVLEGVTYYFANGTSYARGGRDGTPRQAPRLSGVVFLTGEAPPDFQHTGSRNRALMLDASLYPPLGALDVPERAEMLEAAWQAGAGLLGPLALERMWAELDSFTAAVRAREADELAALIGRPGREWVRALVAAEIALAYLLEAAGIEAEVPHIVAPALAALGSGRKDVDPPRQALEAVVSLVASTIFEPHDETGEPTGEARCMVGGRTFARFSDGDWLVIARDEAVLKALAHWGGSQAVESHGREWIRRGWVVPDAKGRPTRSKSFNGVDVRCIQLTASALEMAGSGDG